MQSSRGSRIHSIYVGYAQKKDLVTDQVTKYNACLNFHGCKQELGVNCFETYAPVATWMAIRFLLIVAIFNC